MIELHGGDVFEQIDAPSNISMRERAQLSPGLPIEVRVIDGRVELEPACARVKVEKRGGVWVASPVESMPTLTQDQVDAAVDAIRVQTAGPARDE